MIIDPDGFSTIHRMLIYMLIRTVHLSITTLPIRNYVHLWNAIFITYHIQRIFIRFKARARSLNALSILNVLDAIACRKMPPSFFSWTKLC